MAQNTVVIYTTGVAGSGKSYVRCARFVVDELLPHSELKLISNYPILRDRVADELAPKLGVGREKILERLISIPHTELERWRLEQSGPWDYFKQTNLSGCHIAIDEIHNFCGRHQSKEHRRSWQLWLGEIRHRGATVEFLSQNPQKVAKEIDFECGMRYRIENCENIRDPILGVACSDWYELRAAFITGKYVPTIHQLESVNRDGRWVASHAKRYVLDPYYFQFYDSFSTPVTGGNNAESKQYDFQRYSKGMLLYHVCRRNGWPLFWRMATGVGLWWLCFGGGFNALQAELMSKLTSSFGKSKLTQAKKEAVKVVESEDAAKPVVEKPVQPVAPAARTSAAVLPVALPVSTGASNAGASSNRVVPLPVPVFKAPVSSEVKEPSVGSSPQALLCVAAWDQGAVFAELGAMLPGEVVNGFRLEKCSSRGARVNGVVCRVGVRSTPVTPAADTTESAKSKAK